ncbi:hypothetical protein EQU24_19575 [Methylotuvimicrobium buryatense]|uniref:Uncharacterized protein n=1 Tax=Methylotuvimicrobium buryatense TaxID=95641 RepID=A0A4P9URR3_METBY|nr:hypothetical protein EQU24_19575 [Methylotuvimicrobium buryatense]
MPVPRRVRLLDRQASAAGQIFAPAKSAFMPSMAIRFRRRAYMDVFTASCRASDRVLPHPLTFIYRGDCQAFISVTVAFVALPDGFRSALPILHVN